MFFHRGNYYFLIKDAFLLLTQSPWLFTYLKIIIFIVCLKSAATAVLTDGNAANSNIQSQDQSFLSAAKTTSAVIGFNFTEHYDDSTVTAAIENLPFINETTASIENALRLARRQIFETGRENVPDVLVVFVGHLLIGDFTEVSKDLRDKGIKIVVVGIGDGYDINQLDVVASEPKDDNVITIRDAHMDVMEGGVSGAVSQGNKGINCVYYCRFRGQK